MSVSKTTITYTVLHRTSTPVQDIHHATGEAMDGEMIGQEVHTETVAVPDDMVAAELVGLGAVPTFFDFLG